LSTTRALSDEPKPDTAQGVHDTLHELLKNERPGKVLDAGAGEGALTRRLIQMTFGVEACDLNPERFKLTAKECRKVDLNEALPYSDESFDFVVCVETIEHLRDPWHAVSEFRRVLKKNGVLIITMPNILCIPSRLLFLFVGEYSYFSHKRLWEEAIDTYHKLDKHVNPPWFF